MMPLIQDLKFPANSLIFSEKIMDIANLDIFPTGIIEDLIYYLPESEPFSINFESSGLESNLFIGNIGSAKAIIILFASGVILSFVFYKSKRVWNKLKKVFSSNATLRLFLELYQDLTLHSYLNIVTAEWDSVYPSVRYSNILSVIIFSLTQNSLSPLFCSC